MYRSLLILGFAFSFTGCQFSDLPVNDALQLNQCYQNSANLINKITQAKLIDLEVEASSKAYYQPILAKAKSIAKLTKSVYDSSTLLYQQITRLPLDIAIKKEDFAAFQSLKQQAARLQKQSVQLIYESWDNGGIKATIFSDSSRRQESIQRIEAELSPIFLTTQDQQLASMTNRILLTTLGILQQKVKQNEAVFINFFASQVGGITLCGPRPVLVANSSKTGIRLGETYEAEFIIFQQMPDDNYEVSIGDSILKMTDGFSTAHSIPSTTKGEHCFWTSVVIEEPFTKEQTFLRKPFYFEVQ